MIKISHEVPLCLLEESLQFNDYDYCLPHLMDENNEYKQFFIKAKADGRYIMMDNSLHELGQPYSEDRLFYWLDWLKPQEFFVADYWEDKTQSIVSAKKWINWQRNYPNTTFIAVVQGKSYGDVAECYQTYKDLGYKKIAFSYGASYYNDVCPHPNKNLGKALGRIQVISKLLAQGIISKKDSIHLLGCSVPQEFGWYNEMPFITSIDTSNPVMAALDRTEYGAYGLVDKPKSCMNDNFNINKEDIDLDLLKWNTSVFKDINGLDLATQKHFSTFNKK
jgi:hypothetical protein